MNLNDALGLIQKRADFSVTVIRDNAVITLPNKYDISVGFGSGHYGCNRFGTADINAESFEIAVIRPDGRYVDLGESGVLGWQNVDQLLEIVAKYAKVR
jgi:hypothetical protein